MESIWNLVQHERAELVRCLRGLSASDWSVQSQCPGWSVHDVAAHLLNSANTTPTSFAIDIFRARFNIDRQNQDGDGYRYRRRDLECPQHARRGQHEAEQVCPRVAHDDLRGVVVVAQKP